MKRRRRRSKVSRGAAALLILLLGASDDWIMPTTGWAVSSSSRAASSLLLRLHPLRRSSNAPHGPGSCCCRGDMVFPRWGAGRRRRRTTDSALASSTHDDILDRPIPRENHRDDNVATMAKNRKSTSATAIHSFLDHVQQAIESNNLHSLTLRGLSKKAVKQQQQQQQQQNREQDKAAVHNRGSLRMLVARPVVLAASKKKNKTMIQATFKYHGATDIAKNWKPDRCRANLASILLPNDHEDNDDDDDSVVVVPASEWDVGASPLSSPTAAATRTSHNIQSASLITVNRTEWELQQLHTSKPKLRRRRRRSSKQQQLTTGSANNMEASTMQQQQQQHDRIKHAGRSIAVDAPLWRALAVTNARGQLRPGMASKFRQCQKFVEIVERLVLSTCSGDNEGYSSKQPLSVVDMGCGRAYLTFALHAALRETVGSSSMMIDVRGIDVRPKLVRQISEIAAALHVNDTLRFETGTIESFLLEQHRTQREQERTIDVLIALHACDTATDDALWSGISSRARVLVVAPCCHQQVRPQLNRHAAAAARSNDHHHHLLADIWRHNIYRERLAETATDALRALLLEYAGYQVQVFEFVGGEHTSKNVMITAVLRPSQHKKPATTKKDQQSLLERIRTLVALHGIREQKLAEWMGISLVEGGFGDDVGGGRAQTTTSKPLSARSMPPLKSYS